MEKEFLKRKNTRLQIFDYNKRGAYFITICTDKRLELLSRIVGGDVLDAPYSVKLLPYGKIADKYINQLGCFYDGIRVERYVIMPDHIHILLTVWGEDAFSYGSSGTSTPTTKQHASVPRFVSTLKRFCNKEFGNNIWQRSFYDHIIRDGEDYKKHIKYIYENPKRWYFDERDESLWNI